MTCAKDQLDLVRSNIPGSGTASKKQKNKRNGQNDEFDVGGTHKISIYGPKQQKVRICIGALGVLVKSVTGHVAAGRTVAVR
tara:strand:- start:216 stop:461 length:246 start_codon:yes stop_codon:yes gene_type:complete